MSLSGALKEDIKSLKQVLNDIIEADMNGNTQVFEQLGKTYGPIARRVFFMFPKAYPMLLNPWIVATRAWRCGHSDLGAFEFWDASMVVAMCGFLDSIKIEEKDDAGTSWS